MSLVPNDAQTSVVRIAELKPADSPRLSGEDVEYSQLLAEVDGKLPPILVHRASMRVIDGMHRLSAALLRGETIIEVQFFDGPEREAFVAAVRANMAHGLPLSLADRQAAAARIMSSHPEWSDRAIAAATGLAARTVSGVRRRAGMAAVEVTARIGQDGRTRPLSSAAGRQLASELISRRPEASLREIAREAGISPATARDVRARVRRGEHPIPPRERRHAKLGGVPAGDREQPAPRRHAGAEPVLSVDAKQPVLVDRASVLQGLRNDPSLRFTESGRALLRWLLLRANGPDGWEDVVTTLPPHCAYVVADLARHCAEEWSAFAGELEQRVRRMA
jgi:hypothetical protein